MTYSVYPRSNTPNFYCKFQIQGILVHESTRTSDLNKAHAYAKARYDAVEESLRLGDTVTLAECLRVYLGHYTGTKSEKHAKSFCNRIKGIKLDPHTKVASTVPGLDPNQDIHELTHEQVMQWKDAMIKVQKISASSASAAVSHLRRALNLAKDNGKRVPEINFESVPLKTKVARVRDRYFRPHEEAKLLAYFEQSQNKANYDLAVLLFDTGARANEANTLTWSAVDWNRNEILINITKTEDGRERAVLPSITARLRDVLERRFKERDPSNPFIFPGAKSGTHRAYTTKWFKLGCKACEFNTPDDLAANRNQQLTTHSIRKTYGTRLILLGVPMKHVSLLLGHANVKITEKAYSFVQSQDINLNPADLLNRFNDKG